MATPVQVEYKDASHTLHIVFDDDTQCALPTVHLRGYCPCARCQGHSAGPPSWIPVTSWRMATVEDVTPVGNYAMCIVWADGHDTGIYTFARLHELARTQDEIPESERVPEGK